MAELLSIESLEINADQEQVNPFKPIGIGKPLLVRFHTLYPGSLDSGLLSGGEKSILVTSAIKDDITYGIPPKGVHQIFREVTSRKTLHPSAQGEGTPVIYYTRALFSDQLKFSIDIKLDKFNERNLRNLGKFLKDASSLPIFVPYGQYIFLGSKLISLGANFLNNALSKGSLLTYNFDISHNIGGLIDSKSGWFLGIDEEHKDHFKGYSINFDSGKPYLQKEGRKYDGEYPYVLCSVDGTKNRNYDGFRATLASASVLRDFYGDEREKNTEILGEMISLYNDYRYVKKISEVSKYIQLSNDDEEKIRLNSELEAYKANILNEDIHKIIGN